MQLIIAENGHNIIRIDLTERRHIQFIRPVKEKAQDAKLGVGRQDI